MSFTIYNLLVIRVLVLLYASKLLRAVYPDEGVSFCGGHILLFRICQIFQVFRVYVEFEIQVVDVHGKFMFVVWPPNEVTVRVHFQQIIIGYVVFFEVECPVIPHINGYHEVISIDISAVIAFDFDSSSSARLEVVEEVLVQVLFAYIPHIREVEDYLSVAVEVQILADVQVAVDVGALLAADAEASLRLYFALAHVAVEDFGGAGGGYADVAGGYVSAIVSVYFVRIGVFDGRNVLGRVSKLLVCDCRVT